ncbi:MAG: hypothetical protein M1469_02080 [Bacteroidetes bacterium]|nr:hypothetical protein [Bacteroidota bacterium]
MRNQAANRKTHFLTVMVALTLLGGTAMAQSDSSRVAAADSSGYNPNAIAKGQKAFANFLWNNVGADLYLTGEAYTFHFGRVGFLSLTGGGGYGVEVRFKPVFAGYVYTWSSNEMRPRPPGPFVCSSLYAGVITGGYRAEAGEIYGYFLGTDMGSPEVTFKTYFAGLSRRYGTNAFIEPEVRLMFPVDAGYYTVGPPSYNVVKIEHYRVSDLFISFSVKVGLGLGYCR